jgi:hypothetical protein
MQGKSICLDVKQQVIRRFEAGSVRLMWVHLATSTIRKIIKNADK